MGGWPELKIKIMFCVDYTLFIPTLLRMLSSLSSSFHIIHPTSCSYLRTVNNKIILDILHSKLSARR